MCLAISICVPSSDFLYKATPAISLGCSDIHGAHPVTAWPLSLRASSLSILFSTPAPHGHILSLVIIPSHSVTKY